MQQQIFSAPPGRHDALLPQRLCEPGRKWPAQAVPAQDHVGDDLSFNVRRNALASDFDFWQFWHALVGKEEI